LQGVVTGVLAIVGSPLTNELVSLFFAEDASSYWHAHLPSINVTLPVPHLHNASSLTIDYSVMRLGGFEIYLWYEWWLPGILLAGGSTLLFLSHFLLSTLLLGALFGSPTLWRFTSLLEDDEAKADMLDFLGECCAAHAHKYAFGMALKQVWRVENAQLDESFGELQRDFRERGKPSQVCRFFHGTRRDSASAILADGFRLPGWAGMFGRGVYFADCPLKSLQYTGMGLGHKYMLICDVELGHTLVETGSARTDIDPEAGVPIQASGPSGLLSTLMPSLRKQTSFDSISVPVGVVRVPEYIVYNGSQAVPRYILAVAQ